MGRGAGARGPGSVGKEQRRVCDKRHGAEEGCCLGASISEGLGCRYGGGVRGGGGGVDVAGYGAGH